MQFQPLALGTWNVKDQACIDMIQTAYQLGYRMIDTAKVYKNEEVVGEAIADLPREGIFLTSKIWFDDWEDPVAACDGSLVRLKTNYLDLYLLHWPNKIIDYQRFFQGMKQLVDTGKVRHIGVSNCTIAHLEMMLPICEGLGLNIHSNQVEFHPGLYQKELVEYCQSKNIVLSAYSPLGNGRLDHWPLLVDIGNKYNVHAASVAIAWIKAKGVHIVAKSTKEQHLRSNMEALDLNLSDEDIVAIDGLGDQDRFLVPEFAEF